MTHRPRGRCMRGRKAVDRISYLPEEIREIILGYLPVKDAAQTCVLSKVWRHTWTWASISELKVDEEDYTKFSKLCRTIDKILDLHCGSIQKFYLSDLPMGDSGRHKETKDYRYDPFIKKNYRYYLDRWIMKLPKFKIKELVIHQPCYRIPESLFSCNTLQYLCLGHCTIKELPATFKGFKLLQTLELEAVYICGNDLVSLVSCCPKLENLILLLEDEFQHPNKPNLNISAANLKRLKLSGQFEDIQLFAPKLLTLSVDNFVYDIDENSKPITNTNINQVIGSAPVLEELKFGAAFMEFLTAWNIRADNFPKFQNLRKMDLELEWLDENKAAFAVSLLKSAPNLVVLYLSFLHPPSLDTFWESIDDKDYLFENLRFVNIRSFVCALGALPFLKFVLACAPKLLKLTINHDRDCHKAWHKNKRDYKFLEELNRFPRASTRSKIWFPWQH